MKKIARALAFGTATATLLAGCTTASGGDGDGPAETQNPAAAEIPEHETTAGSPIGYGMSVPDGATQLGPLVRKRSARLIATYQDQLAEARQKAAQEEARKRFEEGIDETTPTPTPSPSPSQDTFDELDESPEPDITTALLRVDDKPAEVFESMLAELDELLPDNAIEPSRWSQFCEADNLVYTGCSVTQEGRTTEGDNIKVVVSVDPGNTETLVAPPASDKRPIMTVTAQNTDNPAQGLQDPEDPEDPDSESSATPTPSVTPAPPTQLPEVEGTFPQMETATPAKADASLLNSSWKVRDDVTLLLSGYRPGFAIFVADRNTNADAVARSYVLAFSDKGAPTQDIVEDRNEISTTYAARSSKRGLVATATYVQSGRGNYVALFYTPPAA